MRCANRQRNGATAARVAAPVWNSILRTHSPHTLPHTYAHTFFTGVGVVSPVVRLECRERRLHTLHTFAVGPPRRRPAGRARPASCSLLVFKKKYEKYAMYAPLAVGPPQGTLSPHLVAHFLGPAEKVCTQVCKAGAACRQPVRRRAATGLPVWNPLFGRIPPHTLPHTYVHTLFCWRGRGFVCGAARVP